MHESFRRWALAALGPGNALRRAERLPGSSSTTLYRLQVEQGGMPRDFVLRLYDNAPWLADEPDLPLHEAAALRLAGAAGLPAPELVAFEADGGACGLPVLLMTALPGRVDIMPGDTTGWLEELARMAARIHAVDPGGFAWSYYPYADPALLAVPGWARRPELWARAIAAARAGRPESPPRFIHRDYHPANVLWQDGAISAVVDWPNACRGPVEVDLAHCRVNLNALFGPDAADAFLAAYQRLAGGPAYDPVWDALEVLDMFLWSADPPPPYVYSGWVDHGVRGLTDALMLERTEALLERALDQSIAGRAG